MVSWVWIPISFFIGAFIGAFLICLVIACKTEEEFKED